MQQTASSRWKQHVFYAWSLLGCPPVALVIAAPTAAGAAGPAFFIALFAAPALLAACAGRLAGIRLVHVILGTVAAVVMTIAAIVALIAWAAANGVFE